MYRNDGIARVRSTIIPRSYTQTCASHLNNVYMYQVLIHYRYYFLLSLVRLLLVGLFSFFPRTDIYCCHSRIHTLNVLVFLFEWLLLLTFEDEFTRTSVHYTHLQSECRKKWRQQQRRQVCLKTKRKWNKTQTSVWGTREKKLSFKASNFICIEAFIFMQYSTDVLYAKGE